MIGSDSNDVSIKSETKLDSFNPKMLNKDQTEHKGPSLLNVNRLSYLTLTGKGREILTKHNKSKDKPVYLLVCEMKATTRVVKLRYKSRLCLGKDIKDPSPNEKGLYFPVKGV